MGFLTKLKSKNKDQVEQDLKDVKNSDNKTAAAQQKVDEYKSESKADSKADSNTDSKTYSNTDSKTDSKANSTQKTPATAAAAGTTGSSTTGSSKAKGSAEYIKDIETRRTVYSLNKEVSLSKDKITEIVKKVVAATPSSFNSQPVRAIILYDDKHDKLWNEIAVDALKKVVREENWQSTGEKLQGFAAGAGTILFFENPEDIKKMQEQFPSYEANFPIWAGHSSGATQINVWTALATENIGANLQHYSPLIDEAVAKEYKVPSDWVLTAQLVFGGIAAPPQVPEKIKDAVIVA